MFNFLKIILLLFSSSWFTQSYAVNRDSLWTIWQTKNYPDTVRVKAIHDMAWSYINSDPDSALYLARIELNYCKLKKLRVDQSDALNTIGVAHLMKSENDSALHYLEMSCVILKQVGEDRKLGIAKTNIGSIYGRQDKLYDALRYFYEAADIFEKLGDSSLVIKSFFNIGVIHKKLGEFSKALSLYFDALETSLRYELVDMQSLCYSNIASTYKDIGKPDSTAFYIQKALIIQKQQGDIEGQSRSYYIMAENFLNLRQIDSAKFNAHRSIILNTKMDDERGLSGGNNLLGSIHLLQDNPDSAFYYFSKGLKYGIESSSLINQMNAYEGLSTVFDLKGKNKEAFTNYKMYILLRDSVNSDENFKALAQQEMKYSFNKQAAEDSLKHAQQLLRIEKDNEKQKAISEEANRRNQTIIIGATVVLILVGGIAFILFRSNKQRKADNFLITLQKIEVENQKHLVDEKNGEITDSINYAKRIQAAILPPTKMIAEFLPDSFVLYLPKDIVAGDFYWFHKSGEKILLAVADCTGHGVPGALVSVVCHNALNRSVREFGLEKPNLILDKTRELVIETFEKSEEEVKDGMDISLCNINLSKKVLSFAGANNPIYIIRKTGFEELKPNVSAEISPDYYLMEMKGDKQPIGKYEHAKAFGLNSIQLETGDVVYLFSDGFADQFGGPKGKKLKYQSLKDLLINYQNESMSAVQIKLEEFFEQWKGTLEQIDDVCIIGFRIA